MDHSTHVALTNEELTPAILADATVYGADTVKIGKVSHVHGAGAAMQVIVNVGGFLGIGAKPVAMTIGQLHFMRDDGGVVHATTPLTKDQVEALPEHMN